MGVFTVYNVTDEALGMAASTFGIVQVTVTNPVGLALPRLQWVVPFGQ